jgi:N-acetyl-anhydromuramyl-L-alanine amidase AmpD
MRTTTGQSRSTATVARIPAVMSRSLEGPDRVRASSITPNRTEVTRTFPVLGFTVRTPTAPGWFEVALASDPHLFRADRIADRNPSTFWSSAGIGPLLAATGESLFLVPGPVLAALSHHRLLYFAVATFETAERRHPRVVRPDPAAASSIRIEATFDAERRVALSSTRPPVNYGVAAPSPRWAGDLETQNGGPPTTDKENQPMFTTTPSGPPTGPHGTQLPSGAQGFVYDDGLGMELWRQPGAGPLSASGDAGDDAYGIEAPQPPAYDSTDLAMAAAIPFQQAGQSPDYPQASRFVPAAPGNFRPATGRTIDKVVIHITDGGPNINGTIRWFQDPAAQVSAHYIVGQDGEVVQMVRNADVAYHARGANSTSIGIEHVANTRGLNPTEAQYCASAALVRWLCDTHGIPTDRQHVLGHREAVQTSKSCPGDWDWDYFIGMVQSATCYPRPAAPQPAAQAYGQSQGGATMLQGSSAQAVPVAVPIVSSIVGATMTRILGNEGDISWTLDQVNGWKHPGDQARPVNSAAVANVTLNVPGPKVAHVLGADELYANLRIRFDHDGRSVGNISQQVTQSNDAFGGGLVVTSTVHDVGQVSPSASDPNHFAAVRIEVHYRFTAVFQDDAIYLRELTLYGNGTFQDSGQWTQ